MVSEHTVEDVQGKEGRDGLAENIRLAINKKLEDQKSVGLRVCSSHLSCFNN